MDWTRKSSSRARSRPSLSAACPALSRCRWMRSETMTRRESIVRKAVPSSSRGTWDHCSRKASNERSNAVRAASRSAPSKRAKRARRASSRAASSSVAPTDSNRPSARVKSVRARERSPAKSASSVRKRSARKRSISPRDDVARAPEVFRKASSPRCAASRRPSSRRARDARAQVARNSSVSRRALPRTPETSPWATNSPAELLSAFEVERDQPKLGSVLHRFGQSFDCAGGLGVAVLLGERVGRLFQIAQDAPDVGALAPKAGLMAWDEARVGSRVQLRFPSDPRGPRRRTSALDDDRSVKARAGCRRGHRAPTGARPSERSRQAAASSRRPVR